MAGWLFDWLAHSSWWFLESKQPDLLSPDQVDGRVLGGRFKSPLSPKLPRPSGNIKQLAEAFQGKGSSSGSPSLLRNTRITASTNSPRSHRRGQLPGLPPAAPAASEVSYQSTTFLHRLDNWDQQLNFSMIKFLSNNNINTWCCIRDLRSLFYCAAVLYVRVLAQLWWVMTGMSQFVECQEN